MSEYICQNIHIPIPIVRWDRRSFAFREAIAPHVRLSSGCPISYRGMKSLRAMNS